MRIVGELKKEELNIGKKAVGSNPSSQVPNFFCLRSKNTNLLKSFWEVI
jgi:hypothetical protein